MSTSQRGRELLKPPVVKPVLTVVLMLICMFNTSAKGDFNWFLQHNVAADKVMLGLSGGIAAIPAIITMSTMAFTAQMTLWAMPINILYIWLFGSQVERKLISWRYPLFVLLALVLPALIVAFSCPVGSALYTQKIFGPTLMTCFLLGGYLVFKPKKPFKPQEWKTPKWQIFAKQQAAGSAKMVKVPFVNPNIYFMGFTVWSLLQMYMMSTSRQDVVSKTGQLWVGNVYAALTGGSVNTNSFQVLQPIAAIGSILAGALMAYVLVNVTANKTYKRSASDLQVQAVLQYKELRALDMTHVQAVEGTSKLIGVPADICRDWINKGLQPIKDE